MKFFKREQKPSPPSPTESASNEQSDAVSTSVSGVSRAADEAPPTADSESACSAQPRTESPPESVATESVPASDVAQTEQLAPVALGQTTTESERLASQVRSPASEAALDVSDRPTGAVDSGETASPKNDSEPQLNVAQQEAPTKDRSLLSRIKRRLTGDSGAESASGSPARPDNGPVPSDSPSAVANDSTASTAVPESGGSPSDHSTATPEPTSDAKAASGSLETSASPSPAGAAESSSAAVASTSETASQVSTQSNDAHAVAEPVRVRPDDLASGATTAQPAPVTENAALTGAITSPAPDPVSDAGAPLSSASPSAKQPGVETPAQAASVESVDGAVAGSDVSSQPGSSDSASDAGTELGDAAAASETKTADAAVPAQPAETGESFYTRLKRGLSRTSDQLATGLGNLFLGRKAIDDDLLEDLEAQLLMSDLGIDATQRVIADITARVSRKELSDGEAVMNATRNALLDIVQPCEQPLSLSTKAPFVILVIGVNGAGKTTTIGKLAHRYRSEGKKVMLAAGDTFRAAAVEQLQAWGERNDVPVIAQHTGADSASVLFDALQAAKSRQVDVLIADTAGRLQNKAHLMDELEKVVRVMRKLEPEAPHETLLVLDAGTGQNAVSQADEFNKAVGVSGIVLTKLDGTARGGVIFAIAQKLQRPIRFIGVGESAKDLRPFVAEDFVSALFDRS